MNNQELIALETVLDYLAEEKDDCEAFVERGGNPDDHIFFYIQILKKYVETTNQKHTRGDAL